MGVRGLQTYLEKHCPSACYPVDIGYLAECYKNETGKDPVIVIDAPSFYSLWCKGLDNIIGFEMQKFLHRLRTFVESFQKCGITIKIVFFFDGLIVEQKRKTWLARRQKNLRDVFEVCDLLADGKLTKNIPEKLLQLPPTMGLFTSMLLKYVLNCQVHMSIKECDEEIVEYVRKNECMAILAQDTDFIVSDIKCKLLSSRNFNESNMTTILYDRVELAKILRIETNQLPLFGVLAGNDLIGYEILKRFHSSICRTPLRAFIGFDMLMPTIGRYINNLPDRSIDDILKLISFDIFGNNVNDGSLDLIRRSYNSYLVDEAPEVPNPSTDWSRILLMAQGRHRNVVVPSYIWNILKNQVFELGVSFEDLRKTFDIRSQTNSFVPSATVTRLLRQRIYGILLYEYEQLADVEIKEWCGENINSYQKPVLVKPVEPSVHHPGLLQLWSNNDGDEVGKMKWNLFLSSVSPSITKIDDWCSLPKDLVAISATLFYLFDQKFVNENELNAVIATVATYSLYSLERLEIVYYGLHHPRCTHISVGVIRTFSMVLILMASVGYPVPISGDLILMKFEAKVFQIKFKEMEQNKTVEELCENNAKCIEIFNQMKSVLSQAIR